MGQGTSGRRAWKTEGIGSEAEGRAWIMDPRQRGAVQAFMIFTDVMVNEPANGLSLKSETSSSSPFNASV